SVRRRQIRACLGIGELDALPLKPLLCLGEALPGISNVTIVTAPLALVEQGGIELVAGSCEGAFCAVDRIRSLSHILPALSCGTCIALAFAGTCLGLRSRQARPSF